jgi:hypothetical protein
MKFNGTLLFSHNFAKEERYDDNMLVGFLASLANFGREALKNIIQYMDLGDENKLVLVPFTEQEILAAAIVSSINDNQLVRHILNHILRDFVNNYSPEFNLEEINKDTVLQLIKENLEGKVSFTIYNRLLVAWILLIPLTFLLLFLNILAIDYFFEYQYVKEPIYTQEDIFNQILPQAAFIAVIELIIVFGLPNFLLGYYIVDRIIAFVNSVIYFVVIITTYYYTLDPIFSLLIITSLPLTVIISFGAADFGYRLGIKRKLVKNFK